MLLLGSLCLYAGAALVIYLADRWVIPHLPTLG